MFSVNSSIEDVKNILLIPHDMVKVFKSSLLNGKHHFAMGVSAESAYEFAFQKFVFFIRMSLLGLACENYIASRASYL